MRILLGVLWCSSNFLFSAPTGNPAQPILQKTGIIAETASAWSFRLGYIGDYTFQQTFRNEFKIPGTEDTRTDMQLWTQSAIVVFNVRNRIDIYTLLGSSRMQLDQETITPSGFLWGVGAKIILFHSGRIRGGVDVKYLRSYQKPTFFISEHFAYNILNDYELDYKETQAAFGLSYRTQYVSPYVNVTYLVAKILPDPLMALVRLPTEDYEVDVPSKSVMGTKKWGISAGISLIDNKKATLAVEWRGFNQNGVSATGELRF